MKKFQFDHYPCCFLDVLSSDEDEIDDAGQDYLERLESKINKSASHSSFGISTQIQHGENRSEEDDVDSEFEANEETALESYTTPLDSDESNQDEYMLFKEIMSSKTIF